MRNLGNLHSAIRGSTVAGSPTVKDSGSPLQGARPIPVPSILAGQDISSSISTFDHTPDLHGAQVQQKVPSLLLGEMEKAKALKKHWMDSPNPQVNQTLRYMFDAARNLKESSNHSFWKSSFAYIVRHLPGANEYGEFLSLRGQPSATNKQTLTVNQADAIVAFAAESRSEALLPPEFSQDIDRLVKGHLQWRKEKSGTTELINVACCMQFLKSLHRDEYHSNSIDDDNGIHEYLAQIVSDKDAALSEAAKLKQQSPLLALFMYKLMEHIKPALITSLKINNILQKQPEVCAL